MIICHIPHEQLEDMYFREGEDETTSLDDYTYQEYQGIIDRLLDHAAPADDNNNKGSCNHATKNKS